MAEGEGFELVIYPTEYKTYYLSELEVILDLILVALSVNTARLFPIAHELTRVQQ